MATYLELVNDVLDLLRWGNVTATNFASPPRPAGIVKSFINDAKDEIMAEVGRDLVEQELSFTTTAPGDHTESISGTQYLTGIACAPAVSGLEGSKMVINTAATGTAPGGWLRINSLTGGGTIINVPTGVSSSFTSADWTTYVDEYDCLATVRKVKDAYVNDEPLSLRHVSQSQHLDRWHPGDTAAAPPQEVAVFRSATSGRLWRLRLWPFPDAAYVIRYTAVVRLANLSNSGDSWEIEPEIETMIKDRAMFKALASPLQNDPDLALTVGADLGRRVQNWKDANTPRNPTRRLVRRSPSQSPGYRRRSLGQVPWP